MGTFASEWGPFAERYGQPVRTVEVPPGPVEVADDAIDNRPWWERVWYHATFGRTRDAVRASVTATTDGAKSTVESVKAALVGPFKTAASEAKGIGTRVIIILVLVLLGFLIVNQVIARRVA